MRILVVSNMFPPAALGGYERECAQMVGALRRRGHEVTVLTSAPRLPFTPGDDVDQDVVRQLRVGPAPFGQAWARRPDAGRDRLHQSESNFVDAANVYGVSDAIDRFAPDVVYLFNLHGLGTLGILATVSYRHVPWVCSLADALLAFACAFDGRVLEPLADAVTRTLCGSWITMSYRVRRENERNGPKLRGPVELIPACVDAGAPRSPAPTYHPGEELRLAYSGVVVGFKGVGILIDALRLLRDEGIESVTLELSGTVVDPGLRDAVLRAGLGSKVRFHGANEREAVLDLLSSCHMFGFATHAREPFGKAPLEAAAVGCVPLISNDCGVAEWLVDGVHCLKASRNPAAFAAVLRRVFRGEIALAPIARRGRAAVLRDFTADALAGRVERILQEAARAGTGLRGDTPTALRAALVAERTIADLIDEANERLATAVNGGAAA